MTPRGFSLGIEKILVLAKLDEEFRKKLFSDRKSALDESEIDLSENEISILLDISYFDLRRAVKATRVPETARRAFMKGAARVTVIALIAAGIGTFFIVPQIASTGIRVPSMVAHQKLRRIHFAQEEFKEDEGRFGTLEELLNKQYLTVEDLSEEKTEYTFEIYDITNTGWKAKAVPKRESLKTLYTNQSGEVRRSETKDVGPDSEPLDN